MTKPAKLRIIHVTLYGKLPAGVRKQILWEQKASQSLEGAEWHQMAIHGGEAKESFEKRIPAIFRPIFLRYLYTWCVVFRLSRSYDYVLLRHLANDPFVFLFAPLIPNRIGVHHSREIEELRFIRTGLSGRLASWLERYTGWFAVRTARAILGVTPEMAEYEVNLRAPHKPHSVYANGIDTSTVDILDDNRDAQTLEAAFICHTFSPWHGLDRLIEAVANAPTLPAELTIHLIGNLSDAQKQLIDALEPARNIFKVYGYLESDAYRALLSRCDIGIGSLAMDRQNMRQGTTLKVREMLALGLPIYSGHQDSSLPDDFPYYVESLPLDLEAMCSFAKEMKQHTREDVRKTSQPFIEKHVSMQKVVDWLQTLVSSSPANRGSGAV